MAINKKLIHFKNKENFNTEVAKGNILNNSIVFIQDSKEIYTHGTIYDGSTFDPSDIEASIQEINNRFNISLEYDLVEYPDVVDENNNPIFTSVEEGQTLERAIHTLETNVATLAQEVLNNEEIVSEALVDTANAIGLDENFQYIQNTDTNYISSATSLAEADLLLDQAIKEAKEVFIVTSDMFEETATAARIPSSMLTFTDDGWTDFIEAVRANKIIALDIAVSNTLIVQATPMDVSVPNSGYFILTGLICYSDNGLVQGYISFPSQGFGSPAIYEITFENKNVTSSVLNTPSEIYILDISTYSTPEDFNNLKDAINAGKIIIIDNNIVNIIQNSNSSIAITKTYIESNESSIYNEIDTIFFKSDGTYKEFNNYNDIITDGDGTKFLSDDGEYKEINIEQIKKDVINDGVIEFPSKYEFVDLGLPSGTMWATCNIGANSPEESGLYFAWGETEGYTVDDVAAGKKAFTWDDYKFGNSDALTKYNSTDGLIQLELIDDAAYQRDSTFRVPNYSELSELNNCTTSTWETLNGVNGRRFTSNINGNSIFIPAAGYYNSGSLEYGNSQGYYWINSIVSYSTESGEYFGFREDYSYPYATIRNYGFPIRPVKSSKFAPIDLKNLPKTPYVWDGTTISETIFMELLTAIRSNREIILSTVTGILSYRLISSVFISDTLCLTFCDTLNAPNFIFTVYYITPNSVEFKTTSFYNKRDSDNTRLSTAFYNNPGLITQDTTFTNKGSLSSLEYDGQFNFGDTIYNITFPSGVKWSTDSVLDYKPNHTYQFKIVRGFGVMKEFANS